jgi:hypothetical protein
VTAFFEPERGAALDVAALVAGCVERGARALLLDRAALPDAFFDLRSGIAGELAQKLVNYEIRLAAVVPDLAVHSARFGEFAREANRVGPLRFFATRADAVRWLEEPG